MDYKLKYFSQMANLQFKVTMPTAAEIAQCRFNYEPTDFATFCGARPVSQCYDKLGNKHTYTEVWTRMAVNQTQMRTCTVDNVVHRLMVQKKQDPRLASMAVAPRFQNPVLNALNVMRINGRDYLTMNGQLLSFPQSQVDAYTHQVLCYALQQRACQPMNNNAYQQYYTGNYAYDYSAYYRQYQQYYQQYYQQQYAANYNYQNTKQNYFYYNCYTNNYAYYQYQDKIYALYTYPSYDRKNLIYAWYNLEPIQVARGKDASLQCVRPLFAASYNAVNNFAGMASYLAPEKRAEYYQQLTNRGATGYNGVPIDTNLTPLGQYMNQGLMQQLAESLAFSQVIAKQYAQSAQQQQTRPQQYTQPAPQQYAQPQAYTQASLQPTLGQ